MEIQKGHSVRHAAIIVRMVPFLLLFLMLFGHSAGAEIARRRIAAAKRLLSTTTLSLAEIAGYCGYCHASFLIRSFRKATGVTPAEWRRRPADA